MFVPKPLLLSIEENEQGGVCLDREDTRELMRYLLMLEHLRRREPANTEGDD